MAPGELAASASPFHFLPLEIVDPDEPVEPVHDDELRSMVPIPE